jgi:hypothetical protein
MASFAHKIGVALVSIIGPCYDFLKTSLPVKNRDDRNKKNFKVAQGRPAKNSPNENQNAANLFA